MSRGFLTRELPLTQNSTWWQQVVPSVASLSQQGRIVLEAAPCLSCSAFLTTLACFRGTRRRIFYHPPVPVGCRKESGLLPAAKALPSGILKELGLPVIFSSKRTYLHFLRLCITLELWQSGPQFGFVLCYFWAAERD